MAELEPVHEVSLLRLLLAERRSRDQMIRCDWLRRQLIKQNVLMENKQRCETLQTTSGAMRPMLELRNVYVTMHDMIKSIKLR